MLTCFTRQERLLPVLTSLITATGLLLVASFPALAEESTGDWQGIIANMLHVILHIKKTPAGSYAVTLESPDQGKFILEAERVEITPDHMAFRIASINAGFDGHWNAESQIWQGVWKQGTAAPLEFKRLDVEKAASATQRHHPQEQTIETGPNPYRTEEVSFDGGAVGVRLAGTLTLPTGKGSFPAVILIAGSGALNRDEEVAGHKVFLVLSDALARAGMAVLRYDKRGIADSTGNYGEATTEDFTADAEAALKWLSHQPTIDSKRIGLLGHSEGGLIAPAIAARNPDIAFIVLMAAPGLRGDKIMQMQSELIARANGVPEAQIRSFAANSAPVFDIVQKSSDRAQAAEQIQALMAPFVASGQLGPKPRWNARPRPGATISCAMTRRRY